MFFFLTQLFLDLVSVFFFFCFLLKANLLLTLSLLVFKFVDDLLLNFLNFLLNMKNQNCWVFFFLMPVLNVFFY